MWKSRTAKEQKRVDWEMWVGMQKNTANVLHEAHEQQSGEAVQTWMDNPGHRRILLDLALWEVGFGTTTARLARERGTSTVYVSDFGTRR